MKMVLLLLGSLVQFQHDFYRSATDTEATLINHGEGVCINGC
jgi:hypothetical protein